MPGRPLRKRRRKGFLLPGKVPHEATDVARAEYASVAAFAELALELMAVGAPPDLVARCHRAAVQEVEHAEAMAELEGAGVGEFGAIPGVLGRRIGGRRRTRRGHLARIAAASLVDGWRNEGQAALLLEGRAKAARSRSERVLLARIAADEHEHAALGRDIVLWCHEQEPRAVSRALARV